MFTEDISNTAITMKKINISCADIDITYFTIIPVTIRVKDILLRSSFKTMKITLKFSSAVTVCSLNINGGIDLLCAIISILHNNTINTSNNNIDTGAKFNVSLYKTVYTTLFLKVEISLYTRRLGSQATTQKKISPTTPLKRLTATLVAISTGKARVRIRWLVTGVGG